MLFLVFTYIFPKEFHSTIVIIFIFNYSLYIQPTLMSMQSPIKKNKNFKIVKQKMEDKTRLNRKESVRESIKYSIKRKQQNYFYISLTIKLSQTQMHGNNNVYFRTLHIINNLQNKLGTFINTCIFTINHCFTY